jgi:hypothetical protein
MKKVILLAGLMVPVLAFWSCAEKPVKASFEDTYGVWADAGTEMVRTAKFCILYEKTDDNKLKAVFQTIAHSGDTVIFDDRGVAVFDSTSRKISFMAKDLLNGEDTLVNIDSAGPVMLNHTVCLPEKISDRLMLTAGGHTVEEYLPGEKKLRIYDADGNRRELTLVEKIVISAPYDLPEATADSIGICLHMWDLGAVPDKHPEGYVTGVEINTNKHAYIFYYGNMVYCRAARIRSDNNGTVFVQNIRMMYKPGEFTAAMPENNLAETQQDVVIVDSLFDPKECVFAEDGIYWSLKSFVKDTIIINGCGQEYVKVRKSRDDPDKLEWYEYRPY